MRGLATDENKFERIVFKKKPRVFAWKNNFELVINYGELDLNLLYDLIKADMIIKE